MSDITSPEQLIDTLLDTIIENEANQISLEDNYSAIKKLLMDYHPQKEKPYQIQTKVLTGETAGELQRILNHYLDALSLGKRRSVIDIKYSTMEKGAAEYSFSVGFPKNPPNRPDAPFSIVLYLISITERRFPKDSASR